MDLIIPSDVLTNLINLSIGLFGFCGILLGLFWGFTQFITRGQGMSDFDRREFLDTSKRITKRLIFSILLYIAVCLAYSFVPYIPNLQFGVLYGYGLDIRFFVFLGGLALIAAGLAITLSVLPLIIDSIDYLSRNLK